MALDELRSSPEELARIERFIAAYNSIDDYLQRFMPSPQTFRSAVDAFFKRHPWWQDAETLRVFASLRNFLVHEKTRPFDYPAVPSEAATREIERIRDRLISPARLRDQFERDVVTLAPDEPLRRALELIEHSGHSRFPVYQGHHYFGLLTENGIARALAKSVASNQPFDAEASVRSVLPRETRRHNHRFATPETSVAEAAFWFQANTFLEAVLITDNGHEDGKLRGIVTRGDIAARIE